MEKQLYFLNKHIYRRPVLYNCTKGGKGIDKYSLIGVSFVAVILLILCSLTNVVGYQTAQSSNQKTINTSDDVDIDIHAGAYGITNGNYGLGFVIGITNNLNETITGSIRTYWNFTASLTVRFDNDSFSLSAYHPEIQIVDIDYLHFPFPILNNPISEKSPNFSLEDESRHLFFKV